MSYARFQPMRQHEDVNVFSKNKVLYNAQMIKRDKPIKSGGQKKLNAESTTLDNYKVEGFKKTYDEKNPTTIITFDKVRKGSIHPTQKPAALFEYLIKTYTNEGELVLDNCAGSGTTAIACENTNRKWICIEQLQEYADKAVARIQNHEVLIANDIV
jgi:site-specific DNA-methyltransferase (adenine-specific)